MVELWKLAMCLTASCGQIVMLDVEPTDIQDECIQAAQDLSKRIPERRFICKGVIAGTEPALWTRQIIIGPGDYRAVKLNPQLSWHQQYLASQMAAPPLSDSTPEAPAPKTSEPPQATIIVPGMHVEYSTRFNGKMPYTRSLDESERAANWDWNAPVRSSKLDDQAPAWTDALAEGRRRILERDFLSARAILQAPAEANVGEALLILAETYDPNMLATWGARGASLADIFKARSLYGRALAGGMDQARARLKALD